MVSFVIGSTAFFSKISGFSSKNSSLLCIDDNPDYDFETNYLEGTVHYVRWRNMSKSELLEYHKGIYKGRYIGKFLVPEFANYIGLTIEDLKSLSYLLDYLDERHEYERIIYDSYIQNNGFFLTEEQLNRAYEEYKRERL